MSEAVAVEVKERFVVDNDMKAEWCLSKIRGIRAEQNRETEELQRQMQFYLDQMEMIKAKADEDVKFFEDILSEYYLKRKNDGFTKATKTKESYKLPTGELTMKHREPEFEYKKEQDKTVAYLKKAGMMDYIKVKEETDWAKLKKICTVVGETVAITETGEEVPGITVTERPDEFEVTVK